MVAPEHESAKVTGCNRVKDIKAYLATFVLIEIEIPFSHDKVNAVSCNKPSQNELLLFSCYLAVTDSSY